MYHEMSYEHDFTEMDRETAEKREWLLNALPWVTPLEMEALSRGEIFPETAFPGPWAEYAELDAFVERFKRGKSRLVPCRMHLEGFGISVKLNLVDGTVYIVEDGRDHEMSISGEVRFEFSAKSEARRMSSSVDSGRATLISSDSMQHLVISLEKVNALPAL